MEEYKWIATTEDTGDLVAVGTSIADVTKKAKEKGVEDAVISRAIDKEEAMYYEAR